MAGEPSPKHKLPTCVILSKAKDLARGAEILHFVQNDKGGLWMTMWCSRSHDTSVYPVLRCHRGH